MIMLTWAAARWSPRRHQVQRLAPEEQLQDETCMRILTNDTRHYRPASIPKRRSNVEMANNLHHCDPHDDRNDHQYRKRNAFEGNRQRNLHPWLYDVRNVPVNAELSANPFLARQA